MLTRISIKKSEYSVFFPLFASLSLLTFNTKLLKILKDTLVVTNPSVGAELLPFLKTWALLPLSVVIISFLTRLQRSFSFPKSFGLTTFLFLIFFSGYVFILHPMGQSLYPTELIDHLREVLPSSARNFLLMIKYWPLTLFYVMCDLWPIVMISLLFWRFASQVVTLEQAKRFFPYFSIDIGGIIVGPLMGAVFFYASGLGTTSADRWEVEMRILALIVIAVGIAQFLVFYFHQQHVEYEKESPLPGQKRKAPFRELWSVARSPFFAPLAMIVFLFEFTDNLFDTLWKDTLGIYLPDPESFSAYLGNVTFGVGILATVVPFLISGALLQRHSWLRVAAIAPALLMILSVLFFSCFFQTAPAMEVARYLGFSSISLTVLIGGVQSCVMQVIKCTVFDNTKDLTFLVCPPDERNPARAFSDALATRAGKSSSCLTQQGLLMSTVTLSAAAPYIAGLMGMSIPIWLICLTFVNHNYRQRAGRVSGRVMTS